METQIYSMSKNAEYLARYRGRCKQKGLCPRCGGVREDGGHLCKKCRSDSAKSQIVTKLRLKLQAIEYYSDKTFKCACCGEDDIRFLQIDHINGGGNGHRRALGEKSASHQLTRWLKVNNYPPGYQVLCANCNIARSVYGTCPHQSRKATAQDIVGLTTREIAEFIGAL